MGLFGKSSGKEPQTPDKYRILVTAGPSYDISKHQIVPVNSNGSVTVENDFLVAKVKVRVRGYRGLPSGSPESNIYFEDDVHEKDNYSVAFSFVPKQDIPSLDTVWGNDFDHPIRDRLPPGFNTAFKIVKEFIDPGLSCDAYADEPWLYGPSLSCWFAFRIGDKLDAGNNFAAPDDEHVMRDGADGSGQKIRQDLGIPDDNEKRRKFFLDAHHRKSMVFEKGRVYEADFYNPYLDFGNLALKLPGFSLKVYKYIDAKSHCLRYVFKNREIGDVYINVNFNLLWGDQLTEALAKEGQQQQGQQQEAQQQQGQQRQEQQQAAATNVQNQSNAPSRPCIRDGNEGQNDRHATVNATPGAGAALSDTKTHPAKDGVDEIREMLANTATGNKEGVETSILDVD